MHVIFVKFQKDLSFGRHKLHIWKSILNMLNVSKFQGKIRGEQEQEGEGGGDPDQTQKRRCHRYG